MVVTRTSFDMVWMAEDTVIGDKLQCGAWMTEDVAAGDELRRGTGGEGCGRWQRAPACDVDGGTTGNDVLVPRLLIPRKYHLIRDRNRLILIASQNPHTYVAPGKNVSHSWYKKIFRFSPLTHTTQTVSWAAKPHSQPNSSVGVPFVHDNHTLYNNNFSKTETREKDEKKEEGKKPAKQAVTLRTGRAVVAAHVGEAC
uniref:Uncharacterized protein n=1 Tax=Oryza punctata TaxID=4537 RepID=A0A0E0M5G9_ORYPU